MGDRMSRYSEEADGSLRHVVGLLTSQNVTVQYQASASGTQDRGLLTSGFGVRVPDGAPPNPPLTCGFFGSWAACSPLKIVCVVHVCSIRHLMFDHGRPAGRQRRRSACAGAGGLTSESLPGSQIPGRIRTWVRPTCHCANLHTVIEGPDIAVPYRHAKVRRTGYFRDGQ